MSIDIHFPLLLIVLIFVVSICSVGCSRTNSVQLSFVPCDDSIDAYIYSIVKDASLKNNGTIDNPVKIVIPRILDSYWINDSIYHIETYGESHCNDVKITGRVKVDVDHIYLSYRIIATPTFCFCKHRIIYEIYNLPKLAYYNISVSGQ